MGDSPSVPPRRSERIQKLSSFPTAANESSPHSTRSRPASSGKMGTRRSPLLPTSLETILLSIYPVILVVGSLFALLDPAARAAPYNSTTQFHFANSAPSPSRRKATYSMCSLSNRAGLGSQLATFLPVHPPSCWPKFAGYNAETIARAIQIFSRHSMVVFRHSMVLWTCHH